ncbi:MULTISPECIES: pentapeptide repeat-containing protein [Microbacterium]|uniref:pentapeptide repeat-containing protein n=1 Tax=Microbacterium TaxID=33882 RepID=UPI0011EB1513|nr:MULTISPECIES: pentapeptide repeat-containing protein [Microbacterium]
MPKPPTAPRISAPDLPPVLEPREAARRADLVAAALDLAGTVDLAYATLEQCAVQADADSIDLTGGTLLDVDFPDPRIASLRMRNASVRRLRVTAGRIGTLDLSDARVAELELRDVRIDYLNLGAARADDVDIVGCDIRTIDLPQAELTRVRFRTTRSDEVDPRGLRAKDLDLRGLDALSYLDVQSLRGATLSSMQVQQLAPVMATGLGIIVTD